MQHKSVFRFLTVGITSLFRNRKATVWIFPQKKHKLLNTHISEPYRRCCEAIITTWINRLKGKFGFPQTITRQIIFEIESSSNFVTPKNKHATVNRDMNDNIIIDCAVEAQADYVIIGDDDLLSMNEHKKIKIIGPSEFLRI